MDQILAHVAGWRGQRSELTLHVEEAFARLPEGSVHWFRAVSDWITVQTDFEAPATEARLDALVAGVQSARSPDLRAAAAMALCRTAIRVSERGATSRTEALFQAAFELAHDPTLPPPSG